jgi:hypothetical protein
MRYLLVFSHHTGLKIGPNPAGIGVALRKVSRIKRPDRSGVPLGHMNPLTTYPMAQGESILPDPPCTVDGPRRVRGLLSTHP